MEGDIITLSADTQIKLISIFNKMRNDDSHKDKVLHSMLSEITVNIGNKLKASSVSIYTIDEDGKNASLAVAFGTKGGPGRIAKVRIIPDHEVPDVPDCDSKLGLTGWILATGMSFLARNADAVKGHPHWSHALDNNNGMPIQSFLGIPFRSMNGDIIGMVKAENGQSPFSETDQIVLQTYAGIISRCFHYIDAAGGTENGNLNKDKSNTALTSWARDILLEAVSTEGEMDSFLNIIVKLCTAFLMTDSCGLFLMDDDENTLTQRAGTGSHQIRQAIRSYSLVFPDDVNKRFKRCGNTVTCSAGCPNRNTDSNPDLFKIGVTPWIAKTGRSLYAENYEYLHSHCFHKGTFDELNFKTGTKCGAFYGVPLKVGGKVIGVVKVENISKADGLDARSFSSEDRKRFDILTQDIALSIKLLEEKYKLRFGVITRATPTIFEILHGGLSVPELVQKVVTKTQELFKARACALFLKEGNILVQPEWAARGYSSNKPNVRYYTLVPEESIVEKPASNEQKIGLTVWIAVKRRGFKAKSNLQLTMHPHHKGTFDVFNFKTKEKCESFMGIPLLVQNRLIGVLKVETKMKIEGESEQFTYFSEQDELVFNLIANSAAITIENARLQATQKLYEQITNNPNKLLLYLCQYSHSNAYCVTPLGNVWDILQAERSDTKALISHYQALMMPDFDKMEIDSFITYINQRKDFYDYAEEYSNLYRIFFQALKAQNLIDISNCCGDAVNQINSMRYSNILNEELNYIAGFMGKINERLTNIAKEKDRIKEIENILKQDNEVIHKLGHPEQNIISRIISNWRGIINKITFVTVKNPYRAGLPLGSADQNLFFGREDIIKWIAENLKGHVLVLHGVKRVGKSSILHQLENGVISKELSVNYNMNIFPVFIDMFEFSSVKSTVAFFTGMCSSIQAKIARNFIGMPALVPADSEFATDPYGKFNRYVGSLCEHMSTKGLTLVLMIDEFQTLYELAVEGRIEAGVLSNFRSMLMRISNLACIMAGTIRIGELPYRSVEALRAAEVSRKYDEMVDIALHKEVGFLNKEDTFSLIEKPVEGVTYDKEAKETIYNLTNGQPFLVQLLCRYVIEDMNRRMESNFITKGDVEVSVNNCLMEPNEMFMIILDSCCDSERIILKRLGVRNYIKESSFSMEELVQLTRLDLSILEDSIHMLENKKLIMKDFFDDNKWRYRISIPLFFKWIVQIS